MPPLRRTDLATPAGLALAASLYAAAELLLTLTFGRFLDLGRAEALLFFAWRPWLLIAAALLAAPYAWTRRLPFYASALLLASLCEALLLLPLGADDPWPELLRGLAAALLVLIPADISIQAGRHRLGRIGSGMAAALIAFLLLVPATRIHYDALASGAKDGAAAAYRPTLLVMTSLPIVWGEGGAFDPASRPASSYRALQEEFDVRPIDVADEANLRRGELLLLAQPGWLAPAELAAIDSWVRRGGRALILADPALAWPSALPLGDMRRPVPASLLGPLLAHWGLELRPPAKPGPETLWFGSPARPLETKLIMDSPGRFVGTGKACVSGPLAASADCAIGRGRVTLIADADLLRDDLWVAPGPDGGARHRRIADNPLVVANLLDALTGIERPRVRAPVTWAPSGLPPLALLLALLPAILVACAGLLLIRIRKFKQQTYPQGYKE